MTKKIDAEELRKSLGEAWDDLIVQARAKFPDDVGIMERARDMAIEVQLWATQELWRYNDAPLEGMIVIGSALGNVLASTTNAVEDDEPVPEGGMDSAHKAIHLMTEAISQRLHEIYNGGADPAMVRGTSEIKLKDVGDA